MGKLGESSYFLAKKKQLSFYEGLRPIAASITEGLLLLRSTIVLVCKTSDHKNIWFFINTLTSTVLLFFCRAVSVLHQHAGPSLEKENETSAHAMVCRVDIIITRISFSRSHIEGLTFFYLLKFLSYYKL